MKADSIAAVNRPPYRPFSAAILADLWTFLKRPSLRVDRHWRFQHSIAVLVLNLIVTFVVLMPLKLLSNTGGPEPGVAVSASVAIILAIAVMPIAEEWVFRSWLGDVRWTKAILPLAVLMLFTPFKWLTGGLLAIFLAVLALRAVFTGQRSWSAHWQALFPIGVYFSAIAFAIVHLDPNRLATSDVWAIAFAITTRLFSGLMFTYVRARSGKLSHAIAVHSLGNLLALVVVVLYTLVSGNADALK